jgi:hypothetical protein
MSPPLLTAPQVADDFVEVLCADDELLRAAFDAIIAAGWPRPPSNDPPSSRRSAFSKRPRPRRERPILDDGDGAGDGTPRATHGPPMQRSPPFGRSPHPAHAAKTRRT